MMMMMNRTILSTLKLPIHPLSVSRNVKYHSLLDLKRPLIVAYSLSNGGSRMAEFVGSSLMRNVTCDSSLVKGTPLWSQSHTIQKSAPLSNDKPPETAVDAKPRSSPRVSWGSIWRYLKQDWKLLIGVSVTAILAALINIWTPRVIGTLANILSSSLSSGSSLLGSTSVLMRIREPAVKLLSLFAVQGMLTFVYITLVSVLGERVSLRIRTDLFTSLLSQEMAFFDSRRTGEMMQRLQDDVGEFKHSLKVCVSQGLKSFTQILGSLIGLVAVSSTLTGYLLAVSPVLYGIGNLYGGYLRYLSARAKEADAESSAIASEALSNIRTVRSFAGEEHEVDRYSESLDKAAAAQEKLGFHIGVFQGFTNFSIGSMIVFVLYVGGTMVASGQMTGGDLMSYLISIQTTQKSLSSLSVLFAQSIKAVGSFARIQEYLDRQPAIPSKGGLIIRDLSGEIQFRNVQFAYPTRPEVEVFENFNLTVPAGRILALCGSSGAGKSSVAALIERFYEVDRGSITIDGVDIKDVDPRWLRQNIGFIHQEPILFAGTVLENIRYGRSEATMDEVRQAARDANAAEFIESLPDKYDSVVGERGVTLSGGQRQRIAIARALLKDPKILIFDEATSALDAESERIVQEALNRLMQGRTVVLIAHRLSTIQDAHQIVVLSKGGHIVESGSHFELMHKRGAYFNLYTSTHRSE